MLPLLGSACPHIVVGRRARDGRRAAHPDRVRRERLLRRLLDRRRDRGEVLGEAELDLFVQLVSGVRHLHAHKVVHRDIKPGNIFLDRRNLVRLGDFGIARARRRGRRRRAAAALVGTSSTSRPRSSRGRRPTRRAMFGLSAS